MRSRCIRRVGGKPRRRVETVIKTVYFVDEFVGRGRDDQVLKLFSADDHIIEPPTCGRTGCRPGTATSPRTWSRRTAASTGCTRTAAARRWASTPSSASAATSTTPTRSASPTCAPAATTRRSGPRTCCSDGILASVLFPTLPRFAGTLFLTFKDKDLADVCVQAYNDFVIDEWCPGGPPGMFVPTIISPAVGSRARRPRRSAAAPSAAPGRCRSRRTRCRSGCRRTGPTTGTRCGRPARTTTSCCACTSAPAARSRIRAPRRPTC